MYATYRCTLIFGNQDPSFKGFRRPVRCVNRVGAAMLEFAIVLPIFLLLVFGIIELGRVMMLNQVAVNGCRAACRQAIVPGASNANVLSVVNSYLNDAGVSQTGRVVSIQNSSGTSVDLSTIGSHQSVTVRVQFPYAQNTWGFTTIVGSSNLVSQSTMRRE
jgi:Flp pilus assembly protein TadG